MGRRRIHARSAASAGVALQAPREADPRFVAALARGLDVLRAFTPQDRWLAHGDIVRRTALPGATVSRLTYTLAALGYLRHRPDSGEYALAAAVLGLGFSMLGTFDVGRIARPHMQLLADDCRAAVSMGVRHELTMVYVAHCRSAEPLTLGLDVGARLPVESTAMGRAVLLSLDPIERERLRDALARTQADRWAQVESDLGRAAHQLAARGFVTSESEWESGISAVGAPLWTGDNRAPFGITVGGPSARLTSRVLRDEIGPRLVSVAADVGRAVRSASLDD